MTWRRAGSELTIIYWRDIPAQVTAKSGRVKARFELPQRFQVAVDRAAMHAGLIGSDSYMGAWRRETRPCGDDLKTEVAAVANELISQFSPETVNDLVANGGHCSAAKDLNQP